MRAASLLIRPDDGPARFTTLSPGAGRLDDIVHLPETRVVPRWQASYSGSRGCCTYSAIASSPDIPFFRVDFDCELPRALSQRHHHIDQDQLHHHRHHHQPWLVLLPPLRSSSVDLKSYSLPTTPLHKV